MATRALIARQLENNSIETIYCKYAGHPDLDCAGGNLYLHYNNKETLDNLFKKGDVYLLRQHIEQDEFNSLDPEMVNRYLNDNEPSKTVTDIETLMEYGISINCEYIYLFKDNKWHCYSKDYETIDLADRLHSQLSNKL